MEPWIIDLRFLGYFALFVKQYCAGVNRKLERNILFSHLKDMFKLALVP